MGAHVGSILYPPGEFGRVSGEHDGLIDRSSGQVLRDW